MTSIFYEDIKLCDNSIKECEFIATTKERDKLNQRRKKLSKSVYNKKQNRGYSSAYRK